MATRRMFSQDVVSSDSFLDMPMSAQALYFHLGMYADDDGFVSPQKILRMVGANADDLKVLLAKGFLIEFENKVVVVKHWKQNNFIRNDRYRPTMYSKEHEKMACNNGVYTLYTDGIPMVNRRWTEVGRSGRERDQGDIPTLDDIKKKAFKTN